MHGTLVAAFTLAALVQPCAALVPTTAAARCVSARGHCLPAGARSAPVLAVAERPLPASLHEAASAGCSSGFGRRLSVLVLALLISLPLQFSAAVAMPEATAVAAASSSAAAAPKTGRRYINLTGFPFPLGPFTERRTVQTELVPGKVYSFEQEQKLSGITANVRSVVFRMRDNHLLVYNPVAPTDEFVEQLASLKHEGVSHILLGATAYEHKIFVGPFARKFPDAKVWAVPDQWSFPLDLPAPLLGIDTQKSGGGELTDTAKGSAAYAAAPDFTDEFEVKLLRPAKRLGFGYSANEAALLHKDTKTLALTDALVRVTPTPGEIYDRSDLLAVGDNGRDTNSLGNIILKAAGAVNWRGSAAREVEALWSESDARPAGDEGAAAATAVRLQRGWERNTLLSLYFGPSPSTLVDPQPSFKALENKWLVAPVTDSLIYRSDRVKPEVRCCPYMHAPSQLRTWPLSCSAQKLLSPASRPCRGSWLGGSTTWRGGSSRRSHPRTLRLGPALPTSCALHLCRRSSQSRAPIDRRMSAATSSCSTTLPSSSSSCASSESKKTEQHDE